MVKNRGAVIFVWILVGLFLAVVGWMYFSYQISSFAGSMTGNSVKGAVGSFYETSSINQRVFILLQIILLIVIAGVIFLVVRKFGVKQKLFKNDYVVSGTNKRSQTDLDVLYEMLKRRKEISMEGIERVFRVDSEIALCWSKILEEGDFAEIDYPRFGKPVLRLVGEEGKVVEVPGNVKKKVVPNKDKHRPSSQKKVGNVKKGKDIVKKTNAKVTTKKVEKKKSGDRKYRKPVVKRKIVKKGRKKGKSGSKKKSKSASQKVSGNKKKVTKKKKR